VRAGHDPLAVRFFLIANAHYRSRLRLSEEALHAAAEQVRRLRDLATRLQGSAPGEGGAALAHRASNVRRLYRDALDDDLNLPLGLGLVFDVVREANSVLDEDQMGEAAHREVSALLADADAHLDVIGAEEPGLAAEVEAMIARREAARQARDFGAADSIREELRARGIALEDSKDGVRWRRVQATGVERS
jgi:cysteinyl-tRNA synthetase